MEVQTLLIPQLSQLDDSQKKYLVTRGGSQVQWYPFTAQSSSNSNMVFKLDPPSPSTVLDRNLIIEVDFTLTLTGIPDNGANIVEKDRFGLRAYPFSSVTDTLTCILNGQSVTSQVSNIIHPLSRYNNTAESRSTFSSIFPNTLDMYQTYGVGATNNVLAGFEGTIPGCYQSRGSYPLKVTNNVVGNGADPRTAVVTGTIYEYVNLSPFYQRAQEGTGGLSNIQNLTLNFTMSNLARMFSMNSALTTITAADVTLGATPKIYCGFYTTPVDFSIPRSLNFSFNDYSHFVTSTNTPVPAATTGGVFSEVEITSNVIQFSQLPEKIYVCVRKNRASLTATPKALLTSTDTYFSIASVNINFGNQDGIQSATKPPGLFLQSSRNGCNMSYTEWTGKTWKPPVHGGSTSEHVGTCGSVLAFEMGKDIPLQGLDAVGMSGSWSFQIRVKAHNVSEEDITPELSIISVFDGIMTIEHPGQCYISLGMVTPEQVLQAPNSEESYDDVMRLYGGSFGSNVKRFFKNNAPMLRQLGKTVGMVVAPELTKSLDGIIDRGQNIVQSAQQDARNLTAAQQGAALQGGLRAGMRAGALQGGQVIPKSTLRSRAR